MIFKLSTNTVQLNWKDILWGYNNQLLGWKDIVNFANTIIINGSNNQDIFELSMINHSNLFELDHLLNKITGSLDNYDNSKWLYILLSQLFNEKDSVMDPLGEVERIYADFDYPEEIASFVKYMPSLDDYDPIKHTDEENRERLYSKWKQYLINKHKQFE